MEIFIKAVQGMKHSVIYTDISGKYFRFSGGTWAWRNHNPGNVRPGKISKKHDQIGVANSFAVFANYKSGHDALLDVLKITYGNSSIDQMMAHFAPPKENNTKKYIKYLRKITGVQNNKNIKDFTFDEFEKLWKGIEQFESIREGNIIEVFKVTQVRKNHSQIIYYSIDSDTWVSKEQCIQLSKEGRVELEFCISQTGNTFLRTPPKNFFQEKLCTLIDKNYKDQ